MIGIVDYGAGNLRSVRKALQFLGFEAAVIAGPENLANADRLILPGVGSFGYAMEQIRARRLFEPLKEWLESGRPLMGICLGLQLLTEGSQESPGAAGFAVFKGNCRRFLARRVPQIGWNSLKILRADGLFSGIREGEFFYFANSYYPAPVDEDVECVLAVSEHGVEFPVSLRKGNVRGVQFHPEKSGPAGLRLIENWVERC